MTLVCMGIVDKLGRKKLLFIGMIGMSVSAFSLAIFQTLVIRLFLKLEKKNLKRILNRLEQA